MSDMNCCGVSERGEVDYFVKRKVSGELFSQFRFSFPDYFNSLFYTKTHQTTKTTRPINNIPPHTLKPQMSSFIWCAKYIYILQTKTQFIYLSFLHLLTICTCSKIYITFVHSWIKSSSSSQPISEILLHT
jgi:hypothetical protein